MDNYGLSTSRWSVIAAQVTFATPFASVARLRWRLSSSRSVFGSAARTLLQNVGRLASLATIGCSRRAGAHGVSQSPAPISAIRQWGEPTPVPMLVIAIWDLLCWTRNQYAESGYLLRRSIVGSNRTSAPEARRSETINGGHSHNPSPAENAVPTARGTIGIARNSDSCDIRVRDRNHGAFPAVCHTVTLSRDAELRGKG
jgi:hypothetical protein